MPLYHIFFVLCALGEEGRGGLLSCSVALGGMNSKTKKDELGDAYVCPMYFSHTTKFFGWAYKWLLWPSGDFKAHFTEPLALAL